MRALILVLLLSLPAVASPVRVCIVGDSISEGFYPATRGWHVDLKALNTGDFGTKNTAESGHTITQARAVFDADVLGGGCTHVLFLIGTNSLAAGDSAATMWANLKQMVDLSRADTSGRPGGAVVGLLALLPRGAGAAFTTDLQARLVAFNSLMAAYANGTTILFVDTYTAHLEPASSPPAMKTVCGPGDGLHPDNECQATIAAEVQSAVMASGGWQ